MQGFDDASSKAKGKNLPSPGVGWLGKLGLIAAQGNNLFETLMLNMVFCPSRQLWEEPEEPCWELEQPHTGERTPIVIPRNASALLTLQSRRVLLKRSEGFVVSYCLLGGDFFSEEDAMLEQMTVWKDVKNKKEHQCFKPKCHNDSRYMWRDFGAITASNDGVPQPGVVRWIQLLVHIGILKKYKRACFRITSIQYGSDAEQRALLAKLRRGIGKQPGELPELWSIMLDDLPEDKRIVGMVQDEITRLDDKADGEKLATKALEAAGLKIKNAKEGTDALFFMSKKQAQNLALIAVEHPEKFEDKVSCKQALRNDPSMDMVLFGRMVANDPSLNYDATSQVAHSISTHAVQNEYDYFTAVDDRKEDNESGAAHLDTTEYNSSTLYRYATVNVMELQKNLPGDAAAVVRAFADAFVHAMPTGKQSSFANRTLPADVYVTIRGDQPVNLVPAFEKPVLANRGSGYMEGSEKALAEYATKVYAQGMADMPLLSLCVGDAAEALGAEKVTLSQLLDRVEAWVSEHVKDGGVL